MLLCYSEVMISGAMTIKRQILQLIFVILLIGGIIFSQNTIVQFLNSKTSFVKTKGLIRTNDLPTITICNDNSTTSNIHGTLENAAQKTFDLKIEDIEIYQRSFEVPTCCKKTILVKKDDGDHRPFLSSGLWLTLFIKSSSEKSEYTVLMTSEKNAYGASHQRWYDGKVDSLKFTPGHSYGIRITDVTETNFIGGCSHESYYETLVEKFSTADFTRYNLTYWNRAMEQSSPCKFQNMCLPVTLPSKIPLCKTTTQEEMISQTCYCYYQALLQTEHGIRRSVRNMRQSEGKYRSCSIKEYEFEEDYRGPPPQKGGQSPEKYMRIDFRFKVPRSTRAWTHLIQKTIMTEYYIMDDITFIGIIGGIFGLFVGMSFMDVSRWVVNGIMSAIKIKSFQFGN